MKPARAPAPAAEAVTVRMGDEVLVYHRQTGQVHRLDPIGAIVWQYLDGETTIEALAGDLASAFGADPGVVQRDVVQLLGRLGQAFLLAEGPRPGPISEPHVLANPPSP